MPLNLSINFPDFNFDLQQLKSYIPSNENTDLNQSSEKIRITELPVRYNKYTDLEENLLEESKSEIPLAVIGPRPLAYTIMKDLRHDKESTSTKLNTRALQSVLAYGKFGLISEFAPLGDMEEFLKRKEHHYLNLDQNYLQVMEWFAQLIIGLENIQNCGYVYTDIKLENIIVRQKNHKYILEFIDLESLFHPSATEYMVTRHYEAPYYGMRAEGQMLYALGILFKEIANRSILIKSDLKKVYDLAALLTQKNASSHITLAHLKNNSFFGSDENTRSRFFEKMAKENLKETLYLDGFYFGPHRHFPEQDDAFFIQPEILKRLRLNLNELQGQLESLKIEPLHLERSGLTKIANYYVDKPILESLIKKIHNSQTLLADCAGTPLFKQLAEKLNHSTKILERIKLKYLLIAMEPSQLMSIVNTALKEYTKHIDSPPHSFSLSFWFCEKLKKHNLNGKKTATNFTENLLLGTPASSEIVEKIFQHLEHGQGKWREGSFKSILWDSLQAASITPPEVKPTFCFSNK